MEYGLYIGHSKESIREAREAILAVISAPHADSKTKQEALKAFSAVLGPISNVSISNVNINGD